MLQAPHVNALSVIWTCLVRHEFPSWWVTDDKRRTFISRIQRLKAMVSSFARCSLSFERGAHMHVGLCHTIYTEKHRCPEKQREPAGGILEKIEMPIEVLQDQRWGEECRVRLHDELLWSLCEGGLNRKELSMQLATAAPHETKPPDIVGVVGDGILFRINAIPNTINRFFFPCL